MWTEEAKEEKEEEEEEEKKKREVPQFLFRQQRRGRLQGRWVVGRCVYLPFSMGGIVLWGCFNPLLHRPETLSPRLLITHLLILDRGKKHAEAKCELQEKRRKTADGRPRRWENEILLLLLSGDSGEERESDEVRVVRAMFLFSPQLPHELHARWPAPLNFDAICSEARGFKSRPPAQVPNQRRHCLLDSSAQISAPPQAD
jgi:hypothetical protein